MNYTGITISFACRLCTISFEQINDFLAHKKENHFEEFQQTTSILFEDKPPSNNPSEGFVSQDLLSSVLVKLETFFDDVGLSFEPGLEKATVAEGQISMEPALENILSKIETIENETTLKPENQPITKNPFVLLKRLSPEEISHIQKTETENTVVKNKPVPTPALALALALDNVQKTTSEKPSNLLPVSSYNLDKNPKETFKTEDRPEKKVSAGFGVGVGVGVNKLDAPPTNRNLKVNLNLNEAKLLKCPFPNCVRSFKTPCLLERHRMRHTNKKSFKCPFPKCKLGFNGKWDLQQHFRRHSGIKPYKCTIEGCGKAFANSGTLSNHRMIHSKSRSCKCPHPNCKKTFKLKRCLRRHMLKVHAYKVI